ncbi:MAG: hypothetical protein Q9181_005957 [Wetmoreana brouardii]
MFPPHLTPNFDDLPQGPILLQDFFAEMAPVPRATKGGTARKKPNRPATRTLVRWDDDKDKSLLLAIQYACNQRRAKIPWDLVAQTMGPKFSEGAIVQHLTKVRERCNEQGIPTPPGLKKGGNNGKAAPGTKDDSEAAPSKGATKSKKRTRSQAKDEEELEEQYDVDDAPSSEEYGRGPAKGKKKANAKGKPLRTLLEAKEKSTVVSTAKGKRQRTASTAKNLASGGQMNEGENPGISEGERSPNEQHYAAGDTMWDLGGEEDTEPKIKRSQSNSTNGLSEIPRKILVLKIGTTGFHKLGIAKNMKVSDTEEVTTRGGGVDPEASSYEGKSTGDRLVLKVPSDMEADNDTGVEDEDSGAEYADDGLGTGLRIGNQLRSFDQTRETRDDTSLDLLQDQDTTEIKAGSEDAASIAEAGQNSGSSTDEADMLMLRDIHNESNPFAYFAGPLQSGGQPAVGMQSVNTASYGNHEQAMHLADAMHHNLSSYGGFALSPAAETHSAGHSEMENEQHTWFSSTGSLQSGSPAYQTYTFGQPSNLFPNIGPVPNDSFFEQAYASHDHLNLSPNTGPRGTTNAPQAISSGFPVMDQVFSGFEPQTQGFESDWNHFVNFDDDEFNP